METKAFFALLVIFVKLHFRKWSRYRASVVIWISTIWLTIFVQVTFAATAFSATKGNIFGYNPKELLIFLGIALFATGLAQSIVHGVIMQLANKIWNGNFDFWLVQPIHPILRMIGEDLGFIWFLPHMLVGLFIILYLNPIEQVLLAISAGILAAIIEILLVICICLPAIKWGKWNPDEGLWEYLDNSRSIPIIRSSNRLLIFASFGVLQYSLAIEVVTLKLSFWYLVLIALLLLLLCKILFRSLIKEYTSASS